MTTLPPVAKPSSHTSESHCRNGGCTKAIYRGRVCFRCWAGIKWTSIKQRVANKNGNNNAYVGVPIEFTREQLIQWVLDNPPPLGMIQPSVDRVVAALGYAPGNIRWIEKRDNSRGANRDLPQNMRTCSICKQVKPANNANFPRTIKRGRPTLSTFCKPCNREYQRKWKDDKNRYACQ